MYFYFFHSIIVIFQYIFPGNYSELGHIIQKTTSLGESNSLTEVIHWLIVYDLVTFCVKICGEDREELSGKLPVTVVLIEIKLYGTVIYSLPIPMCIIE